MQAMNRLHRVVSDERGEKVRVPIIVPAEVKPRQGRAYAWMNTNGPVDLTLEPIYINWIKEESEVVEEGEVIAEGEVQKRIIELTAPCDGIIAKRNVGDGCTCSPGEILGYIETE